MGGPEYLRVARQRLQALGLRVVDVAGDGNCMLLAILMVLGRSAAGHTALRAALVSAVAWAMRTSGDRDHVIALAADLEHSTTGEVSISTPEEYEAVAGQSGTYLGNAELRAAAALLRVCFAVHASKPTCPYSDPVVVGDSGPLHHLLHVNGNHYMALLPLVAGRRPGEQRAEDAAAVPALARGVPREAAAGAALAGPRCYDWECHPASLLIPTPATPALLPQSRRRASETARV